MATLLVFGLIELILFVFDFYLLITELLFVELIKIDKGWLQL